MEKKTLQQRLNDITFTISVLERERKILWNRLNYTSCSNCKYLIKTKYKRITHLKCELSVKQITSSRAKACNQFKENESVLSEHTEKIDI